MFNPGMRIIIPGLKVGFPMATLTLRLLHPSLCYDRVDPLKLNAFDFVIEIYQNRVLCSACLCWAMGIQGFPMATFGF